MHPGDILTVVAKIGDDEIELRCKSWLYPTAALVHDMHKAAGDETGAMYEFLFVILDSWSFDDPLTITVINSLGVTIVHDFCEAIIKAFEEREVLSQPQEPGDPTWHA